LHILQGKITVKVCPAPVVPLVAIVVIVTAIKLVPAHYIAPGPDGVHIIQYTTQYQAGRYLARLVTVHFIVSELFVTATDGGAGS
jgi:hypothetical protein